jgi:hypothetical protein
MSLGRFPTAPARRKRAASAAVSASTMSSPSNEHHDASMVGNHAEAVDNNGRLGLFCV